jgi:hypothetical protein
MRKTWLVLIIAVILVIGGYFAYNYLGTSSKYTQTLRSELNPSDYHTPGNQVKEFAETYFLGADYYRVSIMQFSDESSATSGITKLKDQYNPSMIVLNKKYVNYKELSPNAHFYFYQSEKYIIVIDFSGDKNLGDSFVSWYYSKYPNQ